MTTTYWVPTVGTAQAPLSPALGGTGSQFPWTATDDGFLGMNADWCSESGGGLLTAGTLYLQRFIIRQATTITNLWYCLSVSGVGASTGSFVGLYSQSGTLLSGSADIGATLVAAAAFRPFPLSTPQNVAAGSQVWAAMLVNLATTQPTILRQLNTSVPGAGTPNSATNTLRWAQQPAVGTSLPSPLVVASNATTAFTLVAGWT